jgi:hypothetical protein
MANHKPDPAEIAAVNARAIARAAHRAAARAVAVVIRGNKMPGFWLGFDWSIPLGKAEPNGGAMCQIDEPDRSLSAFAGLVGWALWECEQDVNLDFNDAFELALLEDIFDDAAEYYAYVGPLHDLVARLGLGRVELACEWSLIDQLEELRPAIREVAELLIDGHTVSHEDVQAAVDMCRND